MKNKITAAFLSWIIVLSSVLPCAPVFAGPVQNRIAPISAARLTQAPLIPAGLNPSLSLPGGAMLPPSVIPTGFAAGAAESQLRQAPGAAVAAPAGIARVAAAPRAVGAAPAPAAIAQAAAAVETPVGAKPSLLARVAGAIIAKLPWNRVFDASSSAPAAVMGLKPLPAPTLPEGVDISIGEAPRTPRPKTIGGVEVNAFDVPSSRRATSILDGGSRILQADPSSEADVERALREMIDADAAATGVTSNDLKTAHVRRVAGRGEQADTFYAYFHQQRRSTNPDGSVQAVAIHGSYLSFTIKVIGEKPVVMAAMAHLYPNIAVDTNAAMSDAELKARAEARLPQNQGIELAFYERRIIFHSGSWKTVNLYHIDGLPEAVGIMVAIDVATGDVFGWDARLGMAGEGSSVSGTAAGRGEIDDNRSNGKPVLQQQALPWLNVSIAGKAGQTDVNGKFSSSAGAEPVQFTASLSGKWVQVNDRNRQPVKVSATLTPGEEALVVFNPTQSDEFTVSQVNAYMAVTRIHDWWSKLLVGDKRIDRPIPANVNIDDECNAFYTPGRPSLNFFKSSRNCSDTARPGVVAHEYGHFVVDMIVPATTGGLHEGWGDIGSMFLLGTPIIGDGFLKGQNPSYIRHGENNYQYNRRDEVHDQGQAWMGFAWKLRKMLIAALGEAAGAAEAEALIVPTLFAGSTEIPAAMAQVLLNGTDKNGNIRFENEIRAAAKAHGINLPRRSGAFTSVWNKFFSAAVATIAASSDNSAKIDSRLSAQLDSAGTANFQPPSAPSAEGIAMGLTAAAAALATQTNGYGNASYWAHHVAVRRDMGNAIAQELLDLARMANSSAMSIQLQELANDLYSAPQEGTGDASYWTRVATDQDRVFLRVSERMRRLKDMLGGSMAMPLTQAPGAGASKIHADLLAQLAGGKKATAIIVVNVSNDLVFVPEMPREARVRQMKEYAMLQMAPVTDYLEANGIAADVLSLSGVIRADLTLAQAQAIAAMPIVMALEPERKHTVSLD